jgi:hypothetical protein
MTYYVQPHVCQFDGSSDQGSACAPTTLANGVAAVTGGARRPAGVTIHRLIPKSQETDPSVPGWSIIDCDRAMAKIGVAFSIGDNNSGFDPIVASHNSGHYILLQGDSDHFSNATCSGKFDGDHAVGVHPNEKIISGVEYWWLDDPICKTGRWERPAVLKAYAADFAARVGGWRWGQFDHVVPQSGAPAPKPPAVTLKYGGKASHGTKRIKVPAGRSANVRTRPTTSAPLAAGRSGSPLTGGPRTLPNGRAVEYFQVTNSGQLLAGSRVWYGDRTGNRWLHVSSF